MTARAWSFRSGSIDFVVARPSDCVAIPAAVIERLVQDVVREVAQQLTGARLDEQALAAPAVNERLRSGIAGLLEQHELVVLRRGFVSLPPMPEQAEAEPPPGPAVRRAPAPQRSWIEIVLVDEEGNPVADEPYRIELPDGSPHEGMLNSAGRARIDDIDPGTCKVTFPQLNRRPARTTRGTENSSGQ